MIYKNEQLEHINYPMGGLGAGMICLGGNGGYGMISVKHKPNLRLNPPFFAALNINNEFCKVLEGQAPKHKRFGLHGEASGSAGGALGLARFAECEFSDKFPFANVTLKDKTCPLDVALCGYSPFTPPNPDDSSLPFASVSYSLTNNSQTTCEGTFYFASTERFLSDETDKSLVSKQKNGFILESTDKNGHIANFYVGLRGAEQANVNIDVPNGPWFDTLSSVWRDISMGELKDSIEPSTTNRGGVISAKVTLNPGETRELRMIFCWYMPKTDLVFGDEENATETFTPWYATKFLTFDDLINYVDNNYDRLFQQTKLFSDCFYNTDLPHEIVNAVSANLSILKSPTILREKSGRLWCWEGCSETEGNCFGSCTHVWNYAQAICHLFPSLERGMRETEFLVAQHDDGTQSMRVPLPFRRSNEYKVTAADGQLGGILKVYREYCISGDIEWLKGIWEKVWQSMEYCIKKWDPNEQGVLTEPQHNTYDIEFWSANSMCSSFYLAALCAMSEMCEILDDDAKQRYDELYQKGKIYMEQKLFNGEYFIQEDSYKSPDKIAKFLDNPLSDIGIAQNFDKVQIDIIKREGIKYQYGDGCLADGVLGFWLAFACGLEKDIVDADMIKSHLASVYKYNYKPTLINHSNPQRPTFAVGDEGGLLLCSWKQGERPALPFVYSDEVWTGIEYQVAAHLISLGFADEGLDIVRTCRARYDGILRNPFAEYEYGHWYARALSSYSLIQAYTGVRYDHVNNKLTSNQKDSTSFLCTDTGYGTVTVKDGTISLSVVSGNIDIANS